MCNCAANNDNSTAAIRHIASGSQASFHRTIRAISSFRVGSALPGTTPERTIVPSILNLSPKGFGATVLAGVTVPVFDGGTRAAILEQAQTKADNAGLALTRTREEAVRQIVLANNALHTSLSAYTAATAVASASKTTFDAALAAYRSGVGSITDATMAETQLLQARNASTDAYSTALSAAAALALATGSLGAPLP